MSSNITELRPKVKLTVGAQYICFNEGDANGDWDAEAFEADVSKFPTVVQASITDEVDSYEVYASGAVYDADANVLSKTIAVTNVAFDDATIAKMKGESVSQKGVIMEGGTAERPWFAYGIVEMKKGGGLVLRWFPKCKLTENSDEAATSTASHSDQNSTMNIKAYQFNDAGNTDVKAPEIAGITEDAFFDEPLLTAAAVEALIPTPPPGDTP